MKPLFKPLALVLTMAGLCPLFLSDAKGADYYWNPVNPASNFWNDLAYWKSAANGSGTNPTQLVADGIYSTNGKTLATSTGTTTFAGGTLLFAAGQISVKATGTAIATVDHFHSEGGLIIAAGASNVFHNLHANTFYAASGTTLLSASSDAAGNTGRTLKLTIGTLTGSGAIRTDAGTGDNRVIRLGIADATAYSGDFEFTRGTVEFENDFESSGSLTLGGTVRLSLTRQVHFLDVTIDGTPLTDGVYSFETLSSAHGAFFSAGGTGSITVGTGSPIVLAAESLGVRPGFRLTRETVVDASGLVFASGTYGTSMNGQTFQQEGVVSYQGYQYAAYWHSSKRPAVARRALPDGAWETIVFNDYGPISHTDVHNVNVIGICPSDGTVHLSFDHHVSTLHYRRSIAGVATNPAGVTWNQSLFSATTATLIPAEGAIGSVTYPQFFTTPENKLQFACRNGSSGNGDWFLYEYSAGAWVRLGMLFSRSGTYSGKTTRSAYPNQFRYDQNGRLHVTWSWREAGTSLLGNHDLGYAYSDDFARTWKNNAGSIIALLNGATGSANAISIATPGHVAYPVRYNWGYMNTTTQFIDTQGRVHVVSWRNPDDAASATVDMNQWRYFHYWRDTDGTWHERLLPFRGRKPQTVLDHAGNLHVIFSTGTNLNYSSVDPGAVLMIATATEAGGWTDWVVQPHSSFRRLVGEPLLDMGRWERERILSVYHQQEPATAGAPAPLRVTDFAPTAAQVFVSDLPFFAVGDGGSAVRRDRHQNNGPIILNGITFTKGLGVHAPSEILVPLARLHTRFLCDIGLDDSVDTSGSVIFQAWADGTKLFDSGTMTGASANQSIDIDITGKSELRLIVADAGDNTLSDRANWANARLIATPHFAWNDAQFGDYAHEPAIAGTLADPDGDGVVNLFEYALDEDPLAPNSTPPSQVSILGRRLQLTFNRIADPDLIYVVEASDNLIDPDGWQLIWSSTGTDNTAGPVTIVDTSILDDHPRRFLRLQVTGY